MTEKQGVHPNLGQNWHMRMTELAKALVEGNYRDRDIEVPKELQVEAEWVLNDVLYDGSNHEVLKWDDADFHPSWTFVQLKPGELSSEQQDRWAEFMMKAILHLASLEIPTNQFGRTAESGDHYEQALEKLEVKFDPSKAKANQETHKESTQKLVSEVSELKSEVKQLMETIAANQETTK